MAKKRTMLLDGDIVCYQQAMLAEVETKWDDDLWTLHAFEEPARAAVDSMIETLKQKVGATDVIIAFTDGVNWRKDILPTYKDNRKDKRKPMLLKPLRAYCEEKYKTYTRPRLEADDVLGILLTHPKIIPGEKVLVSIDKDFKTIPGKHYNWKDDKSFEIDEEQAQWWHFYQTLMGDATDGYAGCPGIGPKTAEKVLEHGATWETVVGCFKAKGLSEAAALIQARVARICHAKDYDFEKKEVILWNPPEV